MANATVEVTGNECGEQVDEAAVSTADGTVTVEGTIWAPDACYTNAKVGTIYDPNGDSLLLTVFATKESTAAAACAQCIVEIDYTATVEFTGGLPASVAVTHGEGDRQTTVVEQSLDGDA
jgi:hypothetical protein